VQSFESKRLLDLATTSEPTWELALFFVVLFAQHKKIMAKKKVLEDSTNSSSLSPRKQKAILDWIINHSFLQPSFVQYQEEHCDIFGKRGDPIREQSRKRKLYLLRLREENPSRFAAIARKYLSAPAASDPVPKSSPASSDPTPSPASSDPTPSPASSDRSSASDPTPSPQPSLHDLESTMDRLLKQQGATIKLDFESPERNGRLFAFKMNQFPYKKEVINAYQFVLVLTDPRDYPSISVHWDPSSNSAFKVTHAVVPELLRGSENSQDLCNQLAVKMINRLVDLDGASQEDAQEVAVKAVTNLLTFSNDMAGNRTSRLEDIKYELEDGQKFRKKLFGNSEDEISTILATAKCKLKKCEWQAAVVTWMIAVDEKSRKIEMASKFSKEQELEAELEG
jgi:hypothetical protein